MLRLIFAVLLVALSACSVINEPVEIAAGARVEGDQRSVNGPVLVGENAEVAGNLTNVNGPIEVGEQARVGDITNVNGRINLRAGAEAGTIESVNGQVVLGRGIRIKGGISAVNGSVEMEESCQVEGDVVTVNARITLGPQTQVAGKVANVRGKIELDGAIVEAVETTVGSIELTGDTTVTGKLWVKEASNGDHHVPRILIGPGVKVGGPLQFDREVELLIHDSAEVGEIIGAEPKCFSCEITDL